VVLWTQSNPDVSKTGPEECWGAPEIDVTAMGGRWGYEAPGARFLDIW